MAWFCSGYFKVSGMGAPIRSKAWRWVLVGSARMGTVVLALAERQRLGEEYDRFTATRPRALTPAERSQICALATGIPAIWHAPTTTDADRKQLIRHLIERVQVEVLGTTEKVEVQVVWAGGHRATAQIARPVASLTQLSY